MTAPVDVTAPVARLTLAGRLDRIAGYVQRVGDAGRVDAGFARALLEHLEPIVGEAAIQADEIDMLRAQAADREACRAVIQAVGLELDHLERVLADAPKQSATTETVRWALVRIRDVIEKAGVPVRATGLETLEG